MELYEYIPVLTKSSGIRVVIHNNTVMPFPEEMGFAASPNTMTTFSYNRVSV